MTAKESVVATAESPSVDDVYEVRLPDVPDERGRLTVIEARRHVPISIERVFLVHHVPDGTDRGGHAHRDTDQVLSCVAGRMKVDVSDGRNTRTFELSDAAHGLYVPRMVWIRLHGFENGAVLVVYANTHYDRARSIRTWEEYLAALAPSPPVGARRRRPGSPDLQRAILESALGDRGIHSLNDVEQWLEGRRAATRFAVDRKPLARLRGWTFDEASGHFVHRSGRFFRVVGVDVVRDDGRRREWSQPLIHQPEVGIVGFVAQVMDGVLHVLVQAKMEPGNINLLQLSPTVQATRSNFTQVHGGSRPAYVDHFLNAAADDVLVDQLQSEQGTRFLHKRNRNVIVRVPEGTNVPLREDFMWLTLGQLHTLLRSDNVVNMDSRTALSGLRYAVAGADAITARGGAFQQAVTRSAAAAGDVRELAHWLAQEKFACHMDVRIRPLTGIRDWICDDDSIRHQRNRYFSVIGVSVQASTREVVEWDQPLIESAKGGIVCLFCASRDGVMRFLVRARVEPGYLDTAELGPTLQYTPCNYAPGEGNELPPFAELLDTLPRESIRYDSFQSEEGGRFHHDSHRYVIAEVDAAAIGAPPSGFRWATLRELNGMLVSSNVVNVELRSLITCLGLGQASGRA